MRSATNLEQFTASFRYFGDLSGLLRRDYRQPLIEYSFKGHPGVKDAIETMGIPHTEVDVILANGRSVGFDHPLQPHDLIDVYPLYTAVPVQTYRSLTPATPVPATFVIDVHLGKLARRLRLLGFDCLYRNDFADSEILQIASTEGRIILTRDLGILKHRRVLHGYLVRSNQVDVQVREVLQRYRLYQQLQPWQRCLSCNGLLAKVDKKLIMPRLEPKTRRYYHDFRQCAACGRLYWQGTHVKRMNRWLATLL